MFDFKNLQNNAQEVGEKFAHLVTFNNIHGFNDNNSRLSWPNRFQKLGYLGKNVKIMFNEKTITFNFKYKPTSTTVSIISQLITEIKKNKSPFNRFKKSHDSIKMQFFPKNNTDGKLIIWNNVKLVNLQNNFVPFNSDNTLIETSLTCSFSNIDFKCLSSAAINENSHFKKYLDSICQTKHDDCDYLCENPYTNTNEKNITCDEKICETNQSKESEHKSTE